MRLYPVAIVMAFLAGCSGPRWASFDPATATVARGQNAEMPSYSGSPGPMTAPPGSIQPNSISPGSISPEQPRPEQSGPSPRRHPLSLREAIERALNESEVVRTLSGGVNIASTTNFDPLIAKSQWWSAQTAFDPKFKAEYKGSRINKPPSSFFGPGLSSLTRRDEGNFTASLDKSWPLGTTTKIAYDPSLGYLYFPQGASSPDRFNPSYSSDVVVEVRQPLLRGAGRGVNVSPIWIAQTKHEQSQLDVAELTLAEIRSVEEAYWSLQAAHRILASVEEVVPFAKETVRIETLRLESERNTYADVARAKSKLESINQQRFRAERDVKTREYQLRQLIGLPVNDGTSLIPTDAPLQAFRELDHGQLVAEALQSRPDLVRRRLGVRIGEVELSVSERSWLPQLDVFGAYRTSGLAARLDDALLQMREYEYTDWTLGASFEVPLGNRKAYAAVRGNEYRLAKNRALLRQYENQASFQLAEMIVEIETVWKRFQSAMRQSRHTQDWLKVAKIRYSTPPAGNKNQDWLLLSLYDFQQAMQSYIDAITAAGQLLAEYNTLLARLYEYQGTLLDKRNVEFAADTESATGAATTEPVIPAIKNNNAIESDAKSRSDVPDGDASIGHSLRWPTAPAQSNESASLPGQAYGHSFLPSGDPWTPVGPPSAFLDSPPPPPPPQLSESRWHRVFRFWPTRRR